MYVVFSLTYFDKLTKANSKVAPFINIMSSTYVRI